MKVSITCAIKQAPPQAFKLPFCALIDI